VLFEGYTRMVARKKPAPQTKPNFERERSNAPIIQVSGCPGCEDPGCDNKERRPVPAKSVAVEPHVGSRKSYLDYESPWNDIHVPLRPAPHDFVRPDVRRPPLDADKCVYCGRTLTDHDT
jgi:hypothetical protein